MENVFIRLEEPRDYHTVEKVIRAAFAYPERIVRSKIGCPLEHYMVHMLRGKEGIKELSFVAEFDGEIVGYIIYSKAFVVQPNGETADVLNFGPLGVLPEYQCKGVGGALLKYSVAQARALGYGGILFFGRPEYYPQFGFVDAAVFGITTSDGDNFPAFMGMELKQDYFKNIAGKFIEPDIFNDDLNRVQAKEYDKRFLEI